MNDPRATSDRPIPWWLRVVVFLFAVLFAAGAVIALVRPAMLVSPGDPIGGAARIFAGYLAARNFAVATMLLVLLATGARRLLAAMMALAGTIQLFDGGIDCFEGRWVIVPGVAILGLICFFIATRLFGEARSLHVRTGQH